MPKLTRRAVLSSVAAGASALCLPAPSFAAGLQAASFPWEPWTIGADGESAVEGISVRIARWIFQRAGLDARMTLLPWQRCHAEARSGRIDLIWGLTRTPQRTAYLAFSQPLWLSPNLIFFHRDDTPAEPDSWGALAGKTLGMVRGYNYGLDIEALRLRQVHFEIVGSDAALFQMLASRRIDAFVMDWQVYCYHARAAGSENAATPSGIAIPDLAYYIAVAKASPAARAALPAIDRAIASARADGSLAEILNHGIDPAAPPGALPTRIAP